MDGSNLPVPGGSLDAAAIDALIDLLGDDADVLAEVVDACLEEVPTRIAEIRAGAESGDATLVGRAAHTLKSNALTFGALELGRLSAEIEAAARDQDLSAVAVLLPALDREWTDTRPLLGELGDRGRT